MVSFLLPSIQKRLLRYALSRLELLDTDALDLDNLDIAWGNRSTIELKDVGLRVKKLSSLLYLPPNLELQRASILSLRLTVPADIYSSSITIDIDGVDLRIREVSLAKQARTDSVPGGRPRQASVGPPDAHELRGQTRSPQIGGKGSSSKRQRDDIFQDEEDEHILPTSEDLAASFLQADPQIDRTQLGAVIVPNAAHPRESLLEASVAEEDVGTGTGVGLPAFLADFLKGVGDRLQVKVRRLEIRLDVELHTDGLPRGDIKDDVVTVLLKIEDLDYGGLTSESPPDDGSKPPASTVAKDGQGVESDGRPEGSKRIRLGKIQALLISDAALFAGMEMASGQASLVATRSETSGGQRSPLSSRTGTEMGSPPASTSASKSAHQHPTRPTHPDSPSRERPTKSHQPRTLSESVATSDGGRFADLSDEELEASSRASGGPLDMSSRFGDSVLHDSAGLEGVTASDLSIDDIERDDDEASPAFAVDSKASTAEPKTLLTNTGQTSSDARMTTSAVFRSFPSPSRLFRDPASADSRMPSTYRDPTLLDEDEDSPPEGGDDLTTSKIFSHEEAESMYMSALSHDSHAEESRSTISQIWNDSAAPEATGTSTSANRPGDEAEETVLRSQRTTSSTPAGKNRSTPRLEASRTSGRDGKDDLVASPRSSSSPIQAPSDHPTEEKRTASDREGPSSEASSPRSETYSKTTKHVLDLDEVTIWLNDTATGSSADTAPHGRIQTGTADPSPGSSPRNEPDHLNMPGAFSVYVAESSGPRRSGPGPSLPRSQTAPAELLTSAVPPNKPSRQPKEADHVFGTEVLLGKLNVRFDLSIGRLVVKSIQQLTGQTPDEPPSSQPKSPTDDEVATRLRVHAGAISIKLVERLSGTLASSGASSSSRATIEEGFVDEPSNGDVLLQTAFEDLGFESTAKTSSSTTNFWAGKATLGHAKENIISFDEAFRSRMSSRDISTPRDKDVRGSVLQSPDSRRISLTTLPVHVSLNLQKLDETFSWFGGFNSFLGMGSSIASNATITKTGPARPKPPVRPRGVHFAGASDTDEALEASTVLGGKIDLRMGGLAVDVIGRDSQVLLRSSAVKLVSREEGVGAQVDSIIVSGPHLPGKRKDPAIKTELGNVRVEYLPKPKEVDLARLLCLLTPSHNKYGQDDDILLDTLLRQRRQGSVLRITIATLQSNISSLDEIDYLTALGEEMGRLSTVTKYLPEDDRPGILTLGLIRQLDCEVRVDERIGKLSMEAQKIEVAHVNLPSLMAFSVETTRLHRNDDEDLMGKALPTPSLGLQEHYPMIMARMIGDEIEPTIKVKLCNVRIEYRVSTILAMMKSPENQTSEELLVDMTRSVVALTERVQPIQPKRSRSVASPGKDRASPIRRPLRVDVALRDCTIGLNPLTTPSKGLVVLTDTRFVGSIPMKNHFEATLEVNKASLLIVDDHAHLKPPDASERGPSADHQNGQISELCAMGYVSVSYISSARASLRLVDANLTGEKTMDVELKDDLLVLESCADSTQTLISILNGLKPPVPRSVDVKYRTEIIPVQDMLASLTGNAFDRVGQQDDDDEEYPLELHEEGDMVDDDDPPDFGTSFYSTQADSVSQEVADSMLDDEEGELSDLARPSQPQHVQESILAESMHEPQDAAVEEPLNFVEDHFGTTSGIEGTAHEWDSRKNTYGATNEQKILGSPVKVRVRDVHVIWNLFDGYDWQKTRDAIAKTVEAVETKATERRARNDRRNSFDPAEEDESVIGDFLFNSIYIGVSANRDPRELTHEINRNIDDLASETESYTTSTTLAGSPGRQQARSNRPRGRRLRLNRSKHHKMSFELKGISMDLVVFPPGSGETQSSLDVRVGDFEIIDLVPTSTWKKFATYMHDAGDRESGTNMIHLEILNVKPVPELAASEIVVKATVLPLRLHVDQDALDFMTRFFEFKDDSASDGPKADEPFLQRVEVNSVRVRLDYKPKTVDYAGLRSGHTTEFMNFFILDQADMVLRHVIIYGVAGFDKLSTTLNDIWMPDIKKTQLPGVLAGLAPVRSLVTVGGGVRDLVVIPLREYRKDGRIVRSIQKGALTFARTTTSELVRLGAKLAIGTQTVLQGAEEFLVNPSSSSPDPHSAAWEDASLDEEEKKRISLYADQPIGVMQGLRGAYASLERDLLTTRDAIIAMPGEVLESGSAGGAARVVMRRAPTVIFRPAIGASKAISQTLMGATNSLDRGEKRRVDDKYKKH